KVGDWPIIIAHCGLRFSMTPRVHTSLVKLSLSYRRAYFCDCPLCMPNILGPDTNPKCSGRLLSTGILIYNLKNS
uniref:Uncharacterized protein n=1 Tax=Oreochromis aureus TaxID=47969 RepID=A0A668SUX8_OREAU